MPSSRLLLSGLAGLLVLVALAEPRGMGGAPAERCTVTGPRDVDGCVRLNQLQLLGTHNSYHIAPAPEVLSVLGERGRGLQYTHRPLPRQLSDLGIRQLEIDVFADPEGGRYARPAALRLVPGLDRVLPLEALRRPGFKVLHVQDFDVRSHCPTLVACLTEIRDWSRAHPRHVPIMVMLELKDTPLREPSGDIGAVPPLPIDGPLLRALDAEVRSVFTEDHLLTPDDVRRARPTLREALATEGWPLLREVRGKVMLAMDNTDHHRDTYLDGHPSLEGRVMFVSAEPGTPAAAFLKRNEALGEAGARIRPLVEAGYLVRTRADQPVHEAQSGDTTRRDHAFRSGAHFVSTDYPEPSPFGSGYIARLPGAASRLPARCNPVSAPPGCRDEWLEPR